MNDSWQDSVVLITSSDPDNNSFGTGFIIAVDKQSTSFLTCAHVVRDVGGPEKIVLVIDEIKERAIAAYQDEHADLAVLRIAKQLNKRPLPLYISGAKGKPFRLAGFQLEEKRHTIRPLAGILGEQIGMHLLTGTLDEQAAGLVKAWDLEITDKYLLQPGYSGSPVVDAYKRVIGVVRARKGGGKVGEAISIKALKQVWPTMPPDLLRYTVGSQVRSSLGKIFSRPSPPRQNNAAAWANPATSASSLPSGSSSQLRHQEQVSVTLPSQDPAVDEALVNLFSNAPLSSPSTAKQRSTTLVAAPRRFPRKRVFVSVIAACLVIASGLLFYAGGGASIISPNIPATTTANASIAQATATANAVVAQLTATADAVTAVAQQVGDPYGGSLQIIDPMDQYGSAFGWETDGLCNFQSNGYHVTGPCDAHKGQDIIPPQFALEVTLTTSQSCGVIALTFDNNNNSIWIGVCQNGDYIVLGDANSSQNGSAASMNTGTDQSNVIAIVATQGSITLYINNTNIVNIPDNATESGNLTFWGTDSAVALLSSSYTSNDDREVVYSNAYLWTF